MKIAFYKKENGNWDDYIIDMFTGSGGYSHCELVFDGNAKHYDYTKAYCFSISGRDNCARYKTINLSSGHWDIFEITYPSIVESVVLKKSSKYLNTKYDYWGIVFNWIIPTGWQREDRWWCSELVSRLLGEQETRISPNRLSKLDIVRKVNYLID